MFKILFKIYFFTNFAVADWVKLPEISPTAKIPSVVFKLAPPLKSSILSSEILNNVFSVAPSKLTTEFPLINEKTSTRKSYNRKYIQSTVTSKVVNVLDSFSNASINAENFEPVYLHEPTSQDKKKVMYFNKTVQMSVIPMRSQLLIQNEQKFGELDKNSNYPVVDDEEGITISDEPDETYYDDEYYYEHDETTKFNSIKPSFVTTTSIPPTKSHKNLKKTYNQKLQKRTMIQLMKTKQSFGDISFPSFIKFIKKIQESFAIRTARTIGEKIKMLVHFRDQLMLTINKQIRRLWKVQPATKTKTSSNNKRVKRTLGLDHTHGSGAMDFPSAEGALLSICFLTFAVFLIKLVLQVIQTIKMKKAMWATQMMMGTENVVIKRQQRNVENDEEFQNLAKIYESIEKLKKY